MERQVKRRRPRRLARWRARVASAMRWCAARAAAGSRVIAGRLRSWRPAVIVDARRSRARRLRRMLNRATRMQFRALGVTPPDHLLIVVQRSILGDGPLASLLEVYEDAQGARRHVLFLALTVGEESLSDGAVVATLRQQLHAVVEDALGVRIRAVPAETPQVRRPVSVVPLRPQMPEPPTFDEEAPPPDDTWEPVDDGAYAVAAER